MERSLKLKLAAGAAGGLAAAGAGGAIAATQLASPKAEGQAIVNDAAKRLGVKPSALSSALKRAFEDRIDAAVAAGRLTKQEGAALKKQIESGSFLPLGVPMFDHGPPGPGPDLSTAASYLGLSVAKLQSQIEAGKSLAQVAAAEGKSVDGLVGALVADAKTHLDQAVATGRLTKSQETRVLSDIKTRISAAVHGRAPTFRTRPRASPAPRRLEPGSEPQATVAPHSSGATSRISWAKNQWWPSGSIAV